MSEGIGARAKRKEDKRFLLGKGKYTDDIRMDNQAYAAFVRSPVASARIKGIDSSAALAMDGVISVHTGPELKEAGIGDIITGWAITSKDGTPMQCGVWNPLVTEFARYVGDAIAIVVGETPEIARAAAEVIEVDMDTLPAAVFADKALEDGAPQVHENVPGNLIFNWELGDEAATTDAFEGAHHVTELDIINNRLAPNAIEPRSAVAVFDEAEDRYTLYSTSQNPHVARLVLSAFYNVAPEHKLRVIAPDVGGGFGSKIYIYPEEIACLFASMKTNRSVKWTAQRTESFQTDAHARDHVTKAKMAFDADGKMLGFHVDTIANIGAYVSLFATATPTYLYGTLWSGTYQIPAIYGTVRAVHTNTVPVDA
ncbi:MAG: molybdopterin cofactor-binding domain-containing protein, partial [Pseudomonadota bacterium]